MSPERLGPAGTAHHAAAGRVLVRHDARGETGLEVHRWDHPVFEAGVRGTDGVQLPADAPCEAAAVRLSPGGKWAVSASPRRAVIAHMLHPRGWRALPYEQADFCTDALGAGVKDGQLVYFNTETLTCKPVPGAKPVLRLHAGPHFVAAVH